MTKPTILLLTYLPASLMTHLHTAFNCHLHAQLDANQLLALAPSVRGIIASAESSVPRELMAQLPALEIISIMGVGYDGIDLDAAREHNICVTHTPDVSTQDIADFAMGLLLCSARHILRADQFVRRGAWTTGRYPMTSRVFGSRMGIVGLGRIGKAVAVRAQAFGMSIAYTGRTEKTDVPYHWYNNAEELAAQVDYLVVCASAGPDTHAMINQAVLSKLGPKGILINIARGSIVDQDALISALTEGQILAAGLDVFCDEPHISQALKDLPNVVLTPHIASTTDTTVEAMLDLTFDNLAMYFLGEPVLHQVPLAH